MHFHPCNPAFFLFTTAYILLCRIFFLSNLRVIDRENQAKLKQNVIGRGVSKITLY